MLSHTNETFLHPVHCSTTASENGLQSHIGVKGGAMKDHRGGEKLYHLAPLFSINVRANC